MMEMLELRRYVPVFTYRLFLNLKGKNRPVLRVFGSVKLNVHTLWWQIKLSHYLKA
jgi:hypothetical protein